MSISQGAAAAAAGFHAVFTSRAGDDSRPKHSARHQDAARDDGRQGQRALCAACLFFPSLILLLQFLILQHVFGFSRSSPHQIIVSLRVDAAGLFSCLQSRRFYNNFLVLFLQTN